MKIIPSVTKNGIFVIASEPASEAILLCVTRIVNSGVLRGIACFDMVRQAHQPSSTTIAALVQKFWAKATKFSHSFGSTSSPTIARNDTPNSSYHLFRYTKK